MVLKDPSEDKVNPSKPLTDGADAKTPQEEDKDEKRKSLEGGSTPERDTITPDRILRGFREKSPMQEIILLEQNWKKNVQKIDGIISESCARHGGHFSAQLFVKTLRNEETLGILFKLFDWDEEGEIKQEKLVDCARFAFQKQSGSREWVDLIDVVAYVVCGEDGVIREHDFIRIFRSKGVVEKLFKFLTKDSDGLVSRQSVMDLIANLTYARPREGFTKENVDMLEMMFRQALGNKNELTFDDFKKIVTSKNSFFTERVFEIFDRDKNGSISLNEFLDAMHQFTGNSHKEKIKFLFKVYDLDGDGLIQREELQQVMAACLEENGMKFSNEQIEDLTVALFEDADTENRGEITYEALKAQLEKHPGLLENLAISIQRWLVPPKPDTQEKKRFNLPYQLSFRYLKNNYVYLSFLVFYLSINIGLFIDRCKTISDAGGNIYLVLARGCGQCLNFNCAFILVLVLRQTLTFLRVHGAASFLPLDQNLYFHKMVGGFVFFYSALHTLMHLINFTTYLPDLLVIEGEKYTAYEWLLTAKPATFGLVPGWANPTGIILMVVLIIMVICSLPFVRKSGYFEVFYWTHLLYIVFWVLTILHAPVFWKWFVAPGIIFLFEKIYLWFQMRAGRNKTYISSGILLPSKVIHLVVQKSQGFNYCPGDYVYVNIPAIANYEWHPFTISSAPEQDGAFWLHIRAVGEWTNRLYSYFEKQQMQCELAIAQKKHNINDDYKLTIEEQYEQESGNSSDESERVHDGRKNGVLNNGFEGDRDVIIEMEREDDGRGGKSPQQAIAAPIWKKKADKTFSMPDFDKKMKKRQRNLFLRDNMRAPSDPNFDPATLRQAQQIAASPDQVDGKTNSSNFPTLKSAELSFRYMRKRPVVVTLDMPEYTDESGLSSSEPSLCLEDSEEVVMPESVGPKATVVRLTSGRFFGRKSIYSVRSQKRKSKVESRDRRESRIREAESMGLCTVGKPLVIYIDGPYGAPSSHIFRAQHAVLIGTGIGVTPFASILQSIMHRYLKARQVCPSCSHSWTSQVPQSVMNLRKVDFFWINRDQRSFEWFVNLLSQLEIEQAEQGSVLERFLDMHMYITSALQRTDMKAVGLQMALDLLHEKEKRDLITGLKTRTNAGRPNWDKVFKQLTKQKKGKITVFYCGPPALGRTLRYKCDEYGFNFKKEIF